MPQKIKKYFFTIGNFLIGFVLLFTFALSKYHDYQIYRSELLQRQAELISHQEYFKNLDYLQAELKKYEPELIKVNASLPPDPFVATLFDFLQRIASQDGLVLKRIDSDQNSLVSDKFSLFKKEIAIIVDSPYSAFRKFILDIEKSSRLIQIESLSFALPEKGDIFTFNLIASISFLPDNNNIDGSKKGTMFEEF